MREKKKTRGKELPLPLLANPVFLKRGLIHILDETELPFKVKFIKVKDIEEGAWAIRTMKTRAFGQVLLFYYCMIVICQRLRKEGEENLRKALREAGQTLEKTRPTFPFKSFRETIFQWLEEIEGEDIAQRLEARIYLFLEEMKAKRLTRVKKVAFCLDDRDTILTHCNVSGEMVLIGREARIQGKEVSFFVTETRPYFQGSRLTCWELKEEGFSVTLLADNAVAQAISQGLVDKVIVGSDRYTKEGDLVNKVGTYQIALVAKEFGVPFYGLVQPQENLPSSSLIPIEERDPQELLTLKGKKIYPEGVQGFYPAFDITPKALITKVFPL
ncbi:MAG: S-methyl-5-thioribose-1-phosphate isomerase [bacterium]|nr:S-methyl-5-thioribose-1-phosphate isomerase [bacterium]